MGKRLNIELTDGQNVLCSCYWHEAAYTETALDLTEAIVRTYDELFGGSGADLYIAVKLLEAMGGGIVGVERNRINHLVQTAIPDLPPAHSVYDGVICVTEEGIRESRRWEHGRIRIDLTNRTFDFHVHYYTYLEEYIEFGDRVPDCVPWEELPKVDAGPDIFTGIYFDHIDMIRRIVEQCPNGFRLSSGDVIEWM